MVHFSFLRTIKYFFYSFVPFHIGLCDSDYINKLCLHLYYSQECAESILTGECISSYYSEAAESGLELYKMDIRGNNNLDFKWYSHASLFIILSFTDCNCMRCNAYLTLEIL